ncbi:MAG: hypothetical protein GXP48_01010, partial [Acidobacteria bacterium]|nr:hypothetical protein [Acidobacteriota bacterium]
MKRTNELEQRLREIPVADPPENLADRLLADIPDELQAPGGGPAAPRNGWRHQWWMAAAAALVLALTGVVTWKMGPVGPKERGSSLIMVHDQKIPAPQENAPGAVSNPLPSKTPTGAVALPG